MNLPFTKSEHQRQKEELDVLIAKMLEEAVTDDELSKVMEVMRKRKELDKDKKTIDPNTLLTIGANLLGIGLIISHEYWAPITSKALSFVIKGRV